VRVIHSVHSIALESSGLCLSVKRLAAALGSSGVQCTVASIGRNEVDLGGFRHSAFDAVRGMNRLGVSRTLRAWLDRQASERRVDVIHSHGLWSMTNVYPGWVCRRRNIPLMVSAHGSLAPWPFSRGSRLKPLFWKFLQRPAIEHATLFHATCHSEADEIRSYGFTSPIAVIPLGVDIPDSSAIGGQEKSYTVLFLSRIHPKKGVEELVRAWAAVEPRHPDWRLDIAGPDHGDYATSMKALASALRLKRIRFIGELKGDAKVKYMAKASLFVLPTHSENFGLAVAEALACGTPAIVTRGAPWGRLDTEGAGWWIDGGTPALVSALEAAMGRSLPQLAAMGQHGRAWMLRDYDWRQIGETFSYTYQWMIAGGVPPKWVRYE
jgi:glycosyltransferase involved in cell wall biosynthesis